ncbi:hypothetical protein Q1695_007572 [Nippostrongylus brasiliensis]|nr:hypothetical protein Q1695_007572 [Nippostrongylus brasiliensis]
MIKKLLRLIGCRSRQSDAVPRLTQTEIMALKEMWKKAKERDVGQRILFALIEHRPQFREYFGIPVGANSLEDLQHCKQFQVQAYRIQNFLDTAVSTLGFCPLDSVLEMAHRIGQIHFYRGVNFGADNWLAFKKVAVEEITKDIVQKELTIILNDDHSMKLLRRDDSLLEMCQNGNMPAAGVLGWEKLMGAIIREMKRGFLDEARRNCREEDQSD